MPMDLEKAISKIKNYLVNKKIKNIFHLVSSSAKFYSKQKFTFGLSNTLFR